MGLGNDIARGIAKATTVQMFIESQDKPSDGGGGGGGCGCMNVFIAVVIVAFIWLYRWIVG